jgi:hypothetical protein
MTAARGGGGGTHKSGLDFQHRRGGIRGQGAQQVGFQAPGFRAVCAVGRVPLPAALWDFGGDPRLPQAVLQAPRLLLSEEVV